MRIGEVQQLGVGGKKNGQGNKNLVGGKKKEGGAGKVVKGRVGRGEHGRSFLLLTAVADLDSPSCCTVGTVARLPVAVVTVVTVHLSVVTLVRPPVVTARLRSVAAVVS